MSEFVASKTVATTGASRGIGAAAARAFAEAGANVVLMARVGCYLRQAVGRHLVSFRSTDTGIEVIRILHRNIELLTGRVCAPLVEAAP